MKTRPVSETPSKYPFYARKPKSGFYAPKISEIYLDTQDNSTNFIWLTGIVMDISKIDPVFIFCFFMRGKEGA